MARNYRDLMAEVEAALNGRCGRWAEDAKDLLIRIAFDPPFDADDEWRRLKAQQIPTHARVLPGGRITQVN